MIIYFSGTGNSRYCAQMLADKLEDELLDSFHFIKDGIAAEVISSKPLVFVSPTYCWQLPHIFEDFIRTARFEGCKDAYFVMTCGSDIGNAGEKIKRLCEEVGLNFQGVLPVVMPENYIAMFEVPEQEIAKRIVLVAKRPLLKAARLIRKGESFPKNKVRLADKFKSGPLNPIFYKMFVKANAFYAADACVSCGKCESLCVLSNISIKDGKPEWGNQCTHCMACICGCPTEAIEYGKKSIGKPRYWCEEYQEEKKNASVSI